MSAECNECGIFEMVCVNIENYIHFGIPQHMLEIIVMSMYIGRHEAQYEHMVWIMDFMR